MPPSSNEDDTSIRREPELSEMRNRLALMEAQYRASLERNESIERQLRATEELLEQAREKVRSGKRKKIEADHYRSLIHQLRSRWYLRPFLPGDRLQPPQADLADCWIYRGARFDKRSSTRHRVLVVGHLLNSTLFGSERCLLEVIGAIDPEKFDVFAIFPGLNEQVFTVLRPQVQAIGVFDYFWWSKNRPYDEEATSIFEQICRQHAIDLVHANTIMLSDPLIAARRVGIPAISNAHELISRDDELIARLGCDAAEIARIVCENASYLLANSMATLADYPCGGKGGFLYNSFDAEALDLPQSVDPTHFNVGLISSNTLKKGVLDFLELARAAEKPLPTLHFHLIGPETSITREWREGGQTLPANFHFRGHMVNPPDAYRDLNVVVNLSRFAESFGRTVAEALTARRPVIGYRHGALPELIDDSETGFLVPYLDRAAVLDRLRFFVENPAKVEEFGDRGRELSRRRFSREAFSRGLNSLYERLIRENRPAR